MKKRLIALVCAALAVAGCTGAKIIREKTLDNGFIQIVIDSPSLKKNLVSTPTEQTLHVFLPSEYQGLGKSYPVVYYLHGFGGDSTEIMTHAAALKTAMDAAGAGQFIVVGVNGSTSLGGGFYVNSPVTGNWEDYLVREVVPAIDGRFRTLKTTASRGIAGFSMGGFGAFNIGFRHPDMFSAVYLMSPGLFDENGLAEAMPTWWAGFKNAYGQAFSYDTKADSPYAKIPRLDGTDADTIVVKEWNSGFGDLPEKINSYLARKTALRALRITYGTRDSYPWVIKGCVYFSRLLDDAGIAHETLEHSGTHDVTAFLIGDMVEFFSRNLAR